jgi:hypothetical protein
MLFAKLQANLKFIFWTVLHIQSLLMYGKTLMTWTTAHYEYIYENTTQLSLNLSHKMEVVTIIIYMPLYSKAAAIVLEVV